MIHFILNDREVSTAASPAGTLLDFIRYEKQLKGTKIGCREGDCGACSILVGNLQEGKVEYSGATSCLMPLANANGKHIVTIEGVNGEGLTPVQEAFAKEGATQCGFCTPGFIMSLTGFCLGEVQPTHTHAIDAMNGNICRCTGYKSIQRAAGHVSDLMQTCQGKNTLQFAMEQGIVPAYFREIPERLLAMRENLEAPVAQRGKLTRMGGGTDLYVQRHDTITHETVDFLYDDKSLKYIRVTDNLCELGAAVTVTDIADSAVFQKVFPSLSEHIRLVSSMPIRNMATLAGNFVNASPIGDFTIFFQALAARLLLSDGDQEREVALKDFYKGYKQLDRRPEEFVKAIRFELPLAGDLFNFEKVSKRTHLDIASVNSAIQLRLREDVIENAFVSAGGVGPVPMFLAKSSEFLKGRKISASLVLELIAIAQTEIAPISDARGSADYKRLLLGQLIKAHFIKLFPELPVKMLLES
jgi:xanthine dehydrogenase small subunit